MDDAVERLSRVFVTKDASGGFGSVELPIYNEFRAQTLAYFGKHVRVSRRLSGECVGIYERRALVHEQRGHGRLARADVAGQPDTFGP